MHIDNRTAPRFVVAVLAAFCAAILPGPAFADPGKKTAPTQEFRDPWVELADRLIVPWHRGETHEVTFATHKAYKVVIASLGLRPGNVTGDDDRYGVVSSSTGHVAFEVKKAALKGSVKSLRFFKFSPRVTFLVEGDDDVVLSVTL